MNILNINNVTKNYKGSPILNSVNLTIKKGDITWIQVENAISKTLISIFSNQESVTSGEIINESSKTIYIYSEDKYYEKLSVNRFINFCDEVNIGASFNKEKLFNLFFLSDVRYERISKLNLGQIRRVQLLASFIRHGDLFLIQNPLLDLTVNQVKMYLNCLEILSSYDISVIIFLPTIEMLEEFKCDKLLLLNEQRKFIEIKQIQNKNEITKILSKKNGVTYFINPSDINFIEVINSICYIYLDESTYETTYSISELEQKLEHFGFFRSHRSYLINFQKVIEMRSYTKNSSTLVLSDKNNSQVPLSKNKMSVLKEQFNWI